MMCDGMGMFSDLDYKRALLTYDEILYLLPRNVVRFRDITGKRQTLLYPLRIYDSPEFVVHHFTPSENLLPHLQTLGRGDLHAAPFRQAMDSFDPSGRLYAWRVINADGDLNGGESLSLSPDDQPLAAAILLDKFLMAADAARCVPIAGGAYVEQLISAKYQMARANHGHASEMSEVNFPKLHLGFPAVSHAILASTISDDELAKRSFEDIIGFKQENRTLFAQFSLMVRRFTARVDELPATSSFQSQLENLLATDVWEARTELEETLKQRWVGVFRSGLKEAARSEVLGAAVRQGLTGIAIGLLPALSLGTISVTSALAGVAAVAPWLVGEMVAYVENTSKASKHGMYYIHKFVSR
jgi:hypothetical protein